MKELLFTFSGRATRGQYWLSQILFAIPYIMLQVSQSDPVFYSSIIALIALYIPVLFISIKRWHDLNKSGVMVLIGFIPFIGSLICVVMQGFMGPVDYDNNYGENPRVMDV